MKGVRDMHTKLGNIARAHPQKVADAIKAEAEIDAKEMKARTPVDITGIVRPGHTADHGELRDGIHVEEPVIKGREISVMTATSTLTPYDIYVHENPDALHPIGQWKYMESVVNESAPYMLSRIAKRVHFDKS